MARCTGLVIVDREVFIEKDRFPQFLNQNGVCSRFVLGFNGLRGRQSITWHNPHYDNQKQKYPKVPKFLVDRLPSLASGWHLSLWRNAVSLFPEFAEHTVEAAGDILH
jgi:hypothetical protein